MVVGGHVLCDGVVILVYDDVAYYLRGLVDAIVVVGDVVQVMCLLLSS